MKTSTGKTVVKIVSIILVLLVAVGAIGLIAKFTGGFTTDFKTFYVTVGETDVVTEASGYSLKTDESLKVDVKYMFNSPDQKAQGYSVKVVPHSVEGKDFDFTLDGDVYSFQAEDDLTNGFYIEKEETSFTVAPKGNLTEILKSVYPNSTVEDCSKHAYSDMFSLVITSYNGKASVVINFTVAEQVAGIKLDKEVIIF